MGGKRGDAFLIAADAKRVRFGLDDGAARPVVFDLAAGTLVEAPDVPAGLTPPRTDGLPVAKWKDDTAPTFAGRPIALKPYETARSLAVRADHAGFVLGTEWWLRALDRQGHERWDQASPGITYGVNLTPDGRIVVAAYYDGTVRWHRWSDGQELLALFVNKATKAWVA